MYTMISDYDNNKWLKLYKALNNVFSCQTSLPLLALLLLFCNNYCSFVIIIVNQCYIKWYV